MTIRVHGRKAFLWVPSSAPNAPSSSAAVCSNVLTGEKAEYAADTVLLAIGMTPETEVFVGDALEAKTIDQGCGVYLSCLFR
jgi:pyruvate/2-oxoglutarate dehydrogenase complex dihydrolipoamide dehydrogenase (E3) component